MKRRMARMKCSDLICPGGLYEEPVLIYLFDDTHICISCLQNIPKFPNTTEIIRLWNRCLPFENVSKSPFFSFISLRGSGRAVYICLVGGVVILDELWAFTGIDIRVNTVHWPGFGDSEVNLATLISVRGNSCLISSAKELFLSSLSKGNTLGLGLCAADTKFFIAWIYWTGEYCNCAEQLV